MGWQEIDLFGMEASSFSEELHAVIVPLFDEGSKRITAWEQESQELLTKMLDSAKGEESQQDYAHNLADLEKSRNEQRGQVLGAAGLHYLYSTLKSRLKELARYFDQSHPRSVQPYEGKSELDRLRAEFGQRFSIDFEESSLFASIRELALARNAGIHPESLGEYITKVTPPRFYKGGEFYVDRADFMQILDETEKFFDWVVNKMLPLRK